MRRVLAVLVLASFAAGPALRLPCLFACADVQHAAVPASCHSDAASGPTVAGARGCPSDGLSAALVVKRADTAAPLVGALLIQTSSTRPSPDVAAAAALGVDLASLRPPLIRFLIPLRI